MIAYTIGYEGLCLDRLLDLLERHGIEKVIDVRELPLSRKKDFSKNSLAAAVKGQHIQYEHARRLGCPRSIRHAYREDKDWIRYKRRFLTHIAGQTDALSWLLEEIETSRCCLLCFEADAAMCHRSLILDQLRQRFDGGLEVRHITPSQTASPEPAHREPQPAGR